MRFPSLSEALIQNLNLLSQKLWFLWLRAVLGLFLGLWGRHIGVSHQNENDADFDTQLGISVARGGKCRGEVRHAMGIAKTLFATKMWYY